MTYKGIFENISNEIDKGSYDDVIKRCYERVEQIEQENGTGGLNNE